MSTVLTNVMESAGCALAGAILRGKASTHRHRLRLADGVIWPVTSKQYTLHFIFLKEKLQNPIVVYLGVNTNGPTLPMYKSRKIDACFILTRNPDIVRAMKMRPMY